MMMERLVRRFRHLVDCVLCEAVATVWHVFEKTVAGAACHEDKTVAVKAVHQIVAGTVRAAMPLRG